MRSPVLLSFLLFYSDAQMIEEDVSWEMSNEGSWEGGQSEERPWEGGMSNEGSWEGGQSEERPWEGGISNEGPGYLGRGPIQLGGRGGAK